MHACVSGVRLLIAAVVIALSVGNVATADAQTFKLAFYNIKSGFGQIGFPGSPTPFAEATNCTDASAPLNAWGVGFVQTELTNSVASDPAVVALGMSEAWTCATPDAVQRALGWAANTGERNGVTIIARYGFAGAAQWLQLDTTQALNPGDTMWVVSAPVCLDAACSRSFPMYAAHWGGKAATQAAAYSLYEGEATQTIDFLEQLGDGEPRVLIGDINVWEGTSIVCDEAPLNSPARSLRAAGYLDAWRAVYAQADGSTSTWNRSGCGTPAGNVFKRIDDAWSKFIAPLSIRRFGMVTPGTAAPSDHAGIVVEYPVPSALVGSVAPTVSLTNPADNAPVSGTVAVSANAWDNTGISRVEFLVDGVTMAVDTTATYSFSWDTRLVPDAAHVLTAAATDMSGNRTVSMARTVSVENPALAGDEIVMHGAEAQIVGSAWRLVADATAASNYRLQSSDSGVTVSTASASPASYVELTFSANAGEPYRLWIRGTAASNAPANDSVFAQFDRSITSSGAPAFVIGTNNAVLLNLEQCDGCGLSGWGWRDGGFPVDVIGPPIYFSSTGTQRVRLQASEDGLGIDQVVLSAVNYRWTSPGVTKDDTTILPSTSGPVPPPPNSIPTVTLTSPSNGATFTAPAAITLAATASDSDGSVARVEFYAGSVLIGSDTSSPYTMTWSNVSARTCTLTAHAIDNAGAIGISSPVSITVSASSGALPLGWFQQDIGTVGVAGSASAANGTWTVSGSGAEVWGTSDQFHFVYEALAGDGEIVARLATDQNVNDWTKAGVMMRETTAANSRHGFVLVTPSGVKGLAFQRRVATAGVSTSTSGGSGMPPAWVRLTRSGSTIAAYRSADGVTWTLVGSDTISMASSVMVGLAVGSHDNTKVATATFDHVSVTAAPAPAPPADVPPTATLTTPANGATFTAPASIALAATASDSDGTVSRVDFYAGSALIGTDTAAPYTVTWNNVAAGSYSLTAHATDNAGASTTSAPVTITVSAAAGIPSPWAQQDIGAVGVTGGATYNNGTWTVSGSGTDVWGAADQLHYVYEPLTGDGEIVARVATEQKVADWTKAGVMIREATAANARQGFMLVTPSGVKGLAFQRRIVTNGQSTNTSGGGGTPPAWVRLTRTGSTIAAYRSADGVTWTFVGSDTISMTATVMVGIAVSSHDNATLATATFDHVSVKAP